jgi:ubiquinone/menaquinone biosynthesis C-methylase UbiE
MRVTKIITDFVKIFIGLKPTKVHNYTKRTNKFARSKSQRIEQKFILKKINKYKKKIILDYGSNDCYFSRLFNKKLKYYGVDNNRELLDKKTKIFSKNFIFLNSKKIPFRQNFFDAIVLSHVIAHIYKPHDLLNRLNKIMKKEGILIIISPNKYYKFFYSFLNLFNKYMPDETIFKHYSIDDIIKLTKKKWKVLEKFSYSINKKK